MWVLEMSAIPHSGSNVRRWKRLQGKKKVRGGSGKNQPGRLGVRALGCDCLLDKFPKAKGGKSGKKKERLKRKIAPEGKKFSGGLGRRQNSRTRGQGWGGRIWKEKKAWKNSKVEQTEFMGKGPSDQLSLL